MYISNSYPKMEGVSVEVKVQKFTFYRPKTPSKILTMGMGLYLFFSFQISFPFQIVPFSISFKGVLCTMASFWLRSYFHSILGHKLYTKTPFYDPAKSPTGPMLKLSSRVPLFRKKRGKNRHHKNMMAL